MIRTSIVSRRRALVIGATLACAVAAPFALAAEEKFPANPIEIVIHSRYGGGTDTTARMMMIRSRRTLGVDMSVNAQRGGSGAQAHQYAMAKRGEAGRALGIAAISSISGGILSLFIFLLATPLLARIATSFRPMEYFALAIFALSMLASISGKSPLRNLIAGAIGVLPAEGATVAAIMGYNEAKRWSKNKEEFGTGCPEGIAGPEAANNAATGGAMVPTLALGIPGSATTAVILAALIMHGFRPGPYLMKETPEFVYAIFAAMLLANFMFLGIGLIGAKVFSRITLIPRTFLWPAVFVFSLIGSYSYGASVFDVWTMLVAGAVGFLMLRHGFGPAPLVMGLILGKLVEESFSQSMILLDNQWWRLFESPVVNVFFVLTVIGLGWPFISGWFDRRKQATAVATDPVGD